MKTKPFHLKDLADWFNQESCRKHIEQTAKQLIAEWLKQGLIARCNPTKGQHHAKMYYKAVQPPF